MRNSRFLSSHVGLLFVFCALTRDLQADPLLSFPNLNDLRGPVFVQPFAGLDVISPSGRTQPFFVDLPDGSFAFNAVVNILGNFQAFDPFGTPTTFGIIGVEVTVFDVGGLPFTPAFGSFDFAGQPSATFVDSMIPFNQTTFFSGDPTLAFSFNAGPSLAYQFVLLTTDLAPGSFIAFDNVATSMVPEPSTVLLLGPGLAVLALLRRRSLLKSIFGRSRQPGG